MRTSCIQLDTNAIDATHHNVIERSLQCTLIDIVLVLTNADRLRIDLYQLRQWVHQPSPDGDSATHCYILIRKFLARDLRGRVDRCATFINHYDNYRFRQTQTANKHFRFPPTGTITDRDSLDPKTLTIGPNLGSSLIRVSGPLVPGKRRRGGEVGPEDQGIRFCNPFGNQDRWLKHSSGPVVQP